MAMDVAVKAESKSKPDARPVPVIKQVGIIGAGQMGSGIAHVIALGKYDVLLNDIRKEQVDSALATIEKNMSRQVAKGLVNEDDMKAALARIKFAPDLDAFTQSDMVIEAATEDESIKRRIFQELCPKLKP